MTQPPVIDWSQYQNMIGSPSAGTTNVYSDVERLSWLEDKMKTQPIDCPRAENGVFVCLSPPGSGTGQGVISKEFPTLRQAIDYAMEKDSGRV